MEAYAAKHFSISRCMWSNASSLFSFCVFRSANRPSLSLSLSLNLSLYQFTFLCISGLESCVAFCICASSHHKSSFSLRFEFSFRAEQAQRVQSNRQITYSFFPFYFSHSDRHTASPIFHFFFCVCLVSLIHSMSCVWKRTHTHKKSLLVAVINIYQWIGLLQDKSDANRKTPNIEMTKMCAPSGIIRNSPRQSESEWVCGGGSSKRTLPMCRMTGLYVENVALVHWCWVNHSHAPGW